MATFRFKQRPRAKMTNLPLTYDIIEIRKSAMEIEVPSGTLTKIKNCWDLYWLGTRAKFDSKLQLTQHLRMLGHTVEGLI
jgi:hypothetical protein